MKRTPTITLLIMAAGIGSRYGGGIKQLEPVDQNGHIIMEYSIHDAIEAGFNKIIFIIRRDIESDFKEVIGNRIERICKDKGIEVGYCFQSLYDIPETVPEGRTKPWGTGQAVLAAKHLIHEAFAVINADDYYGKEAFVKLHDYLLENHGEMELCMAGFILKNTLSENGGVTRGICQVQNRMLTEIVETPGIVKTQNGAAADGRDINANSYVSMNMWGLPYDFMDVLEEYFAKFFEEAVPENPLKAEYLLPVLIGQLLKEDRVSVKVLSTSDIWFGVTYAEDKYSVTESFRELIDKGIYEEDLFSDI